MGSGKTYWGNRIARKLELPFYDLDEEIVRVYQKTIPEIFAGEGEEYFRYKEKEVLETLVEENRSMVLSCGGGTPCFFNNIDLMKKYGIVVWLNTGVEVLKGRLLREKSSRPLLNAISDDDLKNYILKKMSERRLYYEQATLIVEEDLVSLDSLLQNILHA